MQKDNLKKYGTVLLAIVIVLTLAFIFSNSMESTVESQKKSEAVFDRIWFLLEIVVGKGNVTDHLVRKLAHFTEFFVLGLELSTLSFLYYPVKRSLYFSLSLPLFCGLLAALTDETIQIAYGRGSQVPDVWLDFLGVSIGVAIVLIIWSLNRKIQKSKVA